MNDWHDNPEIWAELYPILTSASAIESAANEAKQVATLLSLPEKARVLDLCCGPGRHSIALAGMGHWVTGVDATLPYLEDARKRAVEAGVAIELIHDSMLTFRREAAFDAVINLFTSFGYFTSREDDRRALQNMHACLKPGGRAAIEMMGKEVLSRIYVQRRWQESRSGRFWLMESAVTAGWDLVSNRWVFAGGGETKEFTFSHRIYAGTELADMMRSAGFAQTSIFGGLDGTPYDQNAMRLVVVGRK
ncbi:MAG: class I SAM-dependent methyltransferase [Acidobacteria bacterium]|nr:class I SAM-dependent methyltransferase [Acidobacteriota bacterium]